MKPHNVMLAKGPGGQEVAKLLDFGIAKTFEEGTQLTQTGFAIGTPQYMAPEQVEGRVLDIDASTDQFALAVIAFRVFAVIQRVANQAPLDRYVGNISRQRK
jgi:serine/threonine-protein kinase